jgi:hypothetical protein
VVIRGKRKPRQRGVSWPRREREEFMQALGLSFTVSTIALAGSLVSAGTLDFGTGLYSLLALVPALAGMIAGQHLLRVPRHFGAGSFQDWRFLGRTWRSELSGELR